MSSGMGWPRLWTRKNIIDSSSLTLTRTGASAAPYKRDWFTSVAHAQVVIESWRREYNEERPKKGLGGLTPAALRPAVDDTHEDGESNRRTLKRSATESGGTSGGPRT